MNLRDVMIIKIEEIKEILDSLIEFINEKSIMGFCNEFENLRKKLTEFEEWGHSKILE